MRRTLLRSPAFARDLRHWLKSRPGAATPIEAALEQLSADAAHPSLRTHKLRGALAECWACSLVYDLRVVFEYAGNQVVRFDLFGMLCTRQSAHLRPISVTQKDSAQLVLQDADGNVRVRIAADSEGNGPALFLVNPKGKTVATLRTTKDGGPMLQLLSDEEKPVLAAGKSKDNGVGFVEFYDGKRQFKGGVGGNAIK